MRPTEDDAKHRECPQLAESSDWVSTLSRWSLPTDSIDYNSTPSFKRSFVYRRPWPACAARCVRNVSCAPPLRGWSLRFRPIATIQATNQMAHSARFHSIFRETGSWIGTSEKMVALWFLKGGLLATGQFPVPYCKNVATRGERLLACLLRCPRLAVHATMPNVGDRHHVDQVLSNA